jgi:hypothetical protein
MPADKVSISYAHDPGSMLRILLKKKSLKVPKGQSESVNRRRTDKTLVKGNRTKEQTAIYKT